MNKRLIEQLRRKYLEIFDEKPHILAKAPGRANIIGEHTDYNGGFVLPVGIDKNIYAFSSKRNDNTVHIYSYDFQESASFSIENLTYEETRRWVNYQKGVFNELQKAGYELSGINMVFGGDIPIAAGLSSSAALELVTAVTLESLFDLNINDLELIKLCQSAEKNFVGVQCGIMDQFASRMAKKDYAVLLDCKTLEYKYIPFKQDSYYIVLCNTLKKRELVDSEYNKRKKECEEGVTFFQKLNPEIEFLRDVDVDLFNSKKNEMPENIQKRCGHVIYENKRVIDCVEALENDDFEKMKNLLFESHYSLKDLYEVSCKELDILVEIARDCEGASGSRMMGAGFGGCTINVVEKSKIEEFSSTINSEYYKQTSIKPEIYICRIEDGAGVID